MTRPFIRIHNVELDEVIDREMNDEEFAQYKKDQEEALNAKLLQDEKIAKRAALLEKLGITEEEAKVLFGQAMQSRPATSRAD